MGKELPSSRIRTTPFKREATILPKIHQNLKHAYFLIGSFVVVLILSRGGVAKS